MIDTHQPLSRGLRAWRLGILTAGHLVVDLYGGLFAPLLPAIAAHTHIGLGRLAILAGISGAVANGVQPPAGLLMHRLRKPVFLFLGPALAVLITGIGSTGSYWVIALLVVSSYAGIGLFHPDGLLAAHGVSGDHEHIGVPVFLSGGFFGYSLGALLGTAWVARFGFDRFALLAAPGVIVLALFAVSGLFRLDHAADSNRSGETDNPDGRSFWLLFSLGSLITMSIALLYTFLTTHLVAVLGTKGLVVGGRALFVIGSMSALASFVWGYLSRRLHPFVLIGLGQAACIPVFVLLVRARSPGAVLLLSTALGPLLGFYPIVATLARTARGLTRGARSGMIVGGCWLIASLPVSLCGWLIDRGVPVQTLLLGSMVPTAAAAVLAGLAYVRENSNTRRNPVAGESR
ncbi:MAG: MFS transporter [Kiritimatiellaeota bacterium]|nr:MFS transporter [Kiritimatiellota bacterium]